MSEEEVRLHLKMLRGDSAQPPIVTVNRSMPIEQFRTLVAQKLGLDNENIKMIFRGKALKPGTTLNEYNVEDDVVIQVLQERARPAEESHPDPPPAPPPAPPPPPPQTHLCEDPAVFETVSKASTVVARVQREVAELQKTIISGDEARARDQALALSELLRDTSRQLHEAASTLRGVNGLMVMDGGMANLTNVINNFQGVVQRMLGPLLG